MKNLQSQNTLSDSLRKLQDSIKFQSAEQIKLQKSFNACEESIKALAHTVNTLPPPTPPRPDPTNAYESSDHPKVYQIEIDDKPVVPPFPTEEIFAKISSISEELHSTIKQNTEDILEYIQNHLKKIEKQTQSLTSTSECGFKELQDKLAWLPMNLSQLSSMAPAEARLFTVEARLRSEENSRIQSYNHMIKLLESYLPSQSDRVILEQDERKPALPVVEIINTSKNIEKKTSPGGMCSSEWWKMAADSERKQHRESESINGIRVKYSTPVPEMDDNQELHFQYKEKRRTKIYPKSGTVNIAMPRIQSAVATKYKNLKNAVKNLKFN